MAKVILASGSKNRQKMMKTLGIPFKVVVSDFDEQSVKESNQKKRARIIAEGKALAVAKNNKEIIVAADTYTVCKKKVLEKPENKKEAVEMLKKLSSNMAICYTGFCLINNGKKFLKTSVTKVWFRKLYQKEIEEYVKKMPVTEWAAAYAPSEWYVLGMINKIKGSLTGLTHGLPTEWLVPKLKKLRFEPKVN